MTVTGEKKDQADKGWDTYAERVTRNEGELDALKVLITERARALEAALEERAESLKGLSAAERDADRREYREALQAYRDHVDAIFAVQSDNAVRELNLLREIYDTRINKLTLRIDHENGLMRDHILSVIASDKELFLNLLEQNKNASLGETKAVEQKMNLKHAADREAIAKNDTEVNRRLNELNGAHKKQLDFQAQSVSREVWDADKAAQIARNEELKERLNKLENNEAKNQGRTLGASALWAGMVAVVAVLASVIVAVNVLLS